MRTIILAVLTVVIVGLVSVGVFDQYQEQKTKKDAATAQRVASEQAAAKAEAEAEQLEAKQLEQLTAECEKGILAYNATTTLQKTQNKLSVPNCGSPSAQ